MEKTTVYLPTDLKRSVKTIAAEQRLSEAELIRKALRSMVEAAQRPRPRIPLFSQGLGDSTAAERVDELLEGFGGS